MIFIERLTLMCLGVGNNICEGVDTDIMSRDGC